ELDQRDKLEKKQIFFVDSFDDIDDDDSVSDDGRDVNIDLTVVTSTHNTQAADDATVVTRSGTEEVLAKESAAAAEVQLLENFEHGRNRKKAIVNDGEETNTDASVVTAVVTEVPVCEVTLVMVERKENSSLKADISYDEGKTIQFNVTPIEATGA